MKPKWRMVIKPLFAQNNSLQLIGRERYRRKVELPAQSLYHRNETFVNVLRYVLNKK